jgi:hypothetical protein
VSFTGLDISGAGATLSAGYIGAPDVADQVMANLISIGGVSYPALVPDSDYTFAGFVIGAEPPSGGGGGGSIPSPVTPPTNPVTDPGTPLPVPLPGARPGTSASDTSSDLLQSDIARIQRSAEMMVKLPPEPECDSDSSHASCDTLRPSR